MLFDLRLADLLSYGLNVVHVYMCSCVFFVQMVVSVKKKEKAGKKQNHSQPEGKCMEQEGGAVGELHQEHRENGRPIPAHILTGQVISHQLGSCTQENQNLFSRLQYLGGGQNLAN